MSAQCGALAALAAILKHGNREDLLPHSTELLHWLVNSNYRKKDVPLIRQLGMKVVQRIGKNLLLVNFSFKVHSSYVIVTICL